MQSLTLLLAALPSLVAAAGSLGFALGAKNADGTCKTTSDYTGDFKTLSSHSTLVRIYAASQCDTAANILPAAKTAGFKVILGIWWVQVEIETAPVKFEEFLTNIILRGGPMSMNPSKQIKPPLLNTPQHMQTKSMPLPLDRKPCTAETLPENNC
jgi:hypothetical protein